jgi:glycosyltransferase involved in cell wall biosynthesis
MHVGVVAPPWIPVPPPAYGGTEAVIAALVGGLSRRGIRTTLFAHADSAAPGTVLSAEPPAAGIHMGDALTELSWAAAADEALEACDVVHHHSFAGLVCSTRSDGLLMTNHGPFESRSEALLRHVATRAAVIAISRSHARDANVPVTVIHHGVDLQQFPIGRGRGGYLLFLGRLDPSKGAHTAIEVAKRAGLPLIIAAKMRDPHERQYFHERIEPHLGDRVRFVKEPGRPRVMKLLGDAVALINPIQWNEPFGMVMIEAQACGTPVLAFDCGAAPELVLQGTTGFISSTIEEMVADLEQIDTLSRDDVRAHVEEHFGADRMVEEHLALYEEVASHPARSRLTLVDSVAATQQRSARPA